MFESLLVPRENRRQIHRLRHPERDEPHRVWWHRLADERGSHPVVVVDPDRDLPPPPPSEGEVQVLLKLIRDFRDATGAPNPGDTSALQPVKDFSALLFVLLSGQKPLSLEGLELLQAVRGVVHGERWWNQ